MKGRMRPSKPVSWLAFVLGLLVLWLGIGTTSDFGLFGISWVVIVGAITIYYLINAVSDKGLSLYSFDTDSGATRRKGKKEPDFATKLRKLESLRKDELISEEEYQEKRQEIMSQKW